MVIAVYYIRNGTEWARQTEHWRFLTNDPRSGSYTITI